MNLEIGEDKVEWPLHGCFNTFPKPIVTIFLAKSEYTHEKMGIQHTMLHRGAYTPYTIQTGVYTAFSISREGIYTIQFTFPTPFKDLDHVLLQTLNKIFLT